MGERSSGAERPTLASVAARAGVSASTASLVFSGRGPVSAAARDRVRAAAADLQYAGPDPTARSLRRGRSGIVGLVTEDRLGEAFRDPVNLALLDGLGEELGDERLGLLVIPLAGLGGPDPGDAALDAAILLGCSTSIAEPLASLRRRGVPIVGVETERLPGVVSIDIDNREASAAAARLVAGLGHRRVTVVSLPIAAYVARERLEGVRSVLPEVRVEAGAASTVAAGIETGCRILGEPDRPTAVIAQSDLLAAGVVIAAEELGLRVPEDLSVVGFDGVPLDGVLSRRLTTVAQPLEAKARAAGRAVLAALHDEVPQEVLLHCELRLGETTGPAPGL